MATSLDDLAALARACVDGNLDVFAPSAKLGWTLTADSRETLLRLVEAANRRPAPSDSAEYAGWTWSFELDDIIEVISEAATNASGITVAEHALGWHKDVIVGFRHAGAVHVGVRHANLAPNPGQLWPELKPWFKQLERNRARLVAWAEQGGADVVVSLAPRPVSAEPPSAASLRTELLAAVIAEPSDVTRRLVYADCLVEQGDPQGELIHLCERHAALDDPEADIWGRIRELSDHYGRSIGIAQITPDFTVERGFISRVAMSASAFVKHGERLLAGHPIELLELKNITATSLPELANALAVHKLRGLHFAQIPRYLRSLPLAPLYESDGFAWLRRLSIQDWNSEGDIQGGFATWAAPQLRFVNLWNVDCAPDILAGLARNDAIRLRELRILEGEKRCGWPLAVFRSPAFVELRKLILSVRSAGPMFERAELPALEVLDLFDGVEPTVRLPRLRSLDLLGPVDADTLFEWIDRHPLLEAVHVRNMRAAEVNRAHERALALPLDHPLVALWLPPRNASRELLARVDARFHHVRNRAVSDG